MELTKSDWGRRTGRTRDLKIKAYFETLTEEEKVNSLLYVKEGRLVGSNTPTTIPDKYKPLLKFKFFCKFCGDYHSHSAGSKFCDKNPDKDKAIENARNKAAHYYYKKGRKQELQNGWNVNRDKIVNRFISKEVRKQRAENLRRIRTGAKLSKDHIEKLKEIQRKKNLSKEAINKSLEKNHIIDPVFVSHNFEKVFGQQKPLNKDGFVIDHTDNQFDRQTYTFVDNFSNRHYDIDGDFDPFS